MEEHQAGEESPLEEFTMAAHINPGATKRRARMGRAAALIGALLLVAAAAAAGFLLRLNISNQDAGAASRRLKVNVTCSLQKTNEQRQHHIFTADRAATYLIYGWLAFKEGEKEEGAEVVVLKQTLNLSEMDLQTKPRASEVFFFEKLKMVDNSAVSVHFSGQLSDGSFHVYEL